MEKRVCFIDDNYLNDFYDFYRNKTKNIDSLRLFKYNNPIAKFIRRLFLKLNLPLLVLFFGDWKKVITNFDLIIIPVNVYSGFVSNFIRKKTDVRIIHWYWNPVTKETNPIKLGIQYQELWSFDSNDCLKYRLNKSRTYYFSGISLEDTEVENDVFFVGADKGRLSELLEIKAKFANLNIKTEFIITKTKGISNDSYEYQSKISYDEVLLKIAKTKVILDLNQKGQKGLSQRPMESIFLKRKLITNDVNITKNDFYSKENIFILEVDRTDLLYEFINSDYIDIPTIILNKYDFKYWVENLLNK